MAENIGEEKFAITLQELEKTGITEEERIQVTAVLQDILNAVYTASGDARSIVTEQKKRAKDSVNKLSCKDDEKEHLLHTIYAWLDEYSATEDMSELHLAAITKGSYRDFPALIDKLGYEKYAHAIAKLILEGKVEPPLTISIQAPWGQGKTSLMRMIKEKLESGLKQTTTKMPTQKSTSGIQSKSDSLINWMNKEKNASNTQMLFVAQGTVPCIWFNPLYYQNSDQIWAGMAHTLLQQLADKLPTTLERERFWFRLRMSRLNTGAIRRHIHKLLLERFIPKGLVWFLILIIMFLTSYLENHAGVFLNKYPILNLLPIVGGSIHAWLESKKDIDLDDKLAQYISEPDYEGKLGLLHLVDQDIDRALKLILDDSKLVIFIDDLDRCEPNVVNTIMLAINQFISVQNRNIIFILGMDTHMVAMAIETAAQKQAETYNKARHSSKRYGWRFMEKFVQLPFFIPRLDQTKAKFYLKNLLDQEAEEKFDASELEKIKNDLSAAGSIERLTELMNALPEMNMQSKIELEKLATDRIVDFTTEKHSETLQKLVDAAIEDLHYNPRDMKRFLNVARLLFLNFENDQNAGSHEYLLKVVRAAHLMLNWPQCLRWLQGNAHTYNSSGDKKDPVQSLSDITIANQYLTFQEWKTEIEKEWGAEVAELIALPDFYAFLRKIELTTPGLPQIFDARLF